MRHDALDPDTKAMLEGLRAHHSIAYSRHTLGFEFSQEEEDKLKGAVHPLVHINPRTRRKSLYLASHASRIIDWPIPEGRLMLRDLIEHATQPQFVYRHQWRVGDLVIWDNRATMHRGRPFDDGKHRRGAACDDARRRAGGSPDAGKLLQRFRALARALSRIVARMARSVITADGSAHSGSERHLEKLVLSLIKPTTIGPT